MAAVHAAHADWQPRIQKCDKPTSRSCRRCQRLGLDCAVTDEALARPHYHTSKERFELMATVIRHFSPATSMSIEDLRDLVSCLPDTEPNCSSPPTQQPTPLLSVSQPAEDGAPEPVPAADAALLSVSDGDLSDTFTSDGSCRRRKSYPAAPAERLLLTVYCNLVGFDGAASYSALRSKVSLCITDRFSQLALAQHGPTFDLRDGTAIPPSLGLSVGLPSRNVCERCSVIFLSQSNSLTYIVSPEKLFDAIDSVYTARNQSPSIHALVVLIVALVNDSPQYDIVSPLQMDPVIEEGSIESVQALILMVRCDPATR